MTTTPTAIEFLQLAALLAAALFLLEQLARLMTRSDRRHKLERRKRQAAQRRAFFRTYGRWPSRQRDVEAVDAMVIRVRRNGVA